jgi:hypothetical protein
MYILFLFSFLSSFYYQAGAAHLYRPLSSTPRCQPFSITFSPSSVSSTHFTPSSPVPFVAISPQASYQITQGGLELLMERPEGTIHTKDGVNDKTAEGATINCTSTIQYA